MADQDDDLLGFGREADDDAQADEQDDADLEASDDDAGEDEQDQPRDERGRFVPVAALKDERDKRQQAERERDEARKAQPPPKSDEKPRELTEAEWVRSQQLDTFEELARDKYGDEVVDEAQKWFSELDQWSQAAIQNSRNPYKELIKRFERHLTQEELAESGVDVANLDDWVLKRAAELQAQQNQQNGGSPQRNAPANGAAPPRSIVNRSSSGGVNAIPTGPGQAFDGEF